MLGDADHPIRPSKSARYGECSIREFLKMIDDDLNDEGGPAAQTGSLTHEGVAAFHKELNNNLKEKAAWDAISRFRDKFPLADTNECRLFLEPYMRDPRNVYAVFEQIKSEPLIEYGVKFSLAPHELDKTGQPIHFEGTLDQVRNINGVPTVYDLKTGKPSGWDMIHEYTFQQCCYVYGARQLGGVLAATSSSPVIIRNHGYRTRENKGISPDGVMWPIPITEKGLEWMLETIRFDVAMFRNGYANFRPGKYCTFCELGGLSNCQQKYERHLILNGG
jgi:hypothetical protein